MNIPIIISYTKRGLKIDWIKNSSSLEKLFSDNHEAKVFSITVTAWSLLLRDEGSGLIRGWERAIRHRTKGGEGVGVSQRLQSVGVGESSGYLEQCRLSYGSLIMYTILVLQYRCRWYSEPLYLVNIATCSMNHIMNVWLQLCTQIYLELGFRCYSFIRNNGYDRRLMFSHFS